MGKSSLRLDTRRALRDGTFPVRIAVGYGTNLYLSTGIFLQPEEWDPVAKKVSRPGSGRINRYLYGMLRQVEGRIVGLRRKGIFKELKTSELRLYLSESANQRRCPSVSMSANEWRPLSAETEDTRKPSVGQMFDRVISTKRGSTRMLFEQTRSKVDAFCGGIGKLPFGAMTRRWLEDFYSSLEPMKVNSRALHIRKLRSVVNFAADEGVADIKVFRRFRVPTEETPMRVLPVEKMRRLRDLPLHGRDAECRDLFLLSFYLIGINMVDLSRVTRSNIRDGRLEYRRAKTGKLYSIRIEPEAEVIINEYSGTSHLLRCFDRYPRHADFAAMVSRVLRRHGFDITPYWARYSWATYAAELDIPKDTISEALGHSYGSRITGVYIKFSRDKIDAANRRVIDFLKGE